MKQFVIGFIAAAWCCAAMAQTAPANNYVWNGVAWVPMTGSSGGQPTIAPTAVAPTDKGGTITAGGTAQTIMASNAARKGGYIQNPCTATEDLWVSTSTTATVTGVGDDADLAPCGSFSLSPGLTVIQTAISVIGSTTSHRFLAKELQ